MKNVPHETPNGPSSRCAWAVQVILALSLGVLAPTGVFAQAVARYSISGKAMDSGGVAARAGEYQNVGSIGGIGGCIATTTGSSDEINRSGFPGQLYDVVSVQIASGTGVLDVNQSIPLQAMGVADDGTYVALDPATVTWQPVTGPIASINARGVLTTGVIYQDTSATVVGSYNGNAGLLNLVVTNRDFSAWQEEYFGGQSAMEAPGADADGTGQTNVFKYIAGLDPLDSRSRFSVSVESSPGSAAIVFSPVAAGRIYDVEYTSDLAGGVWRTLSGGIQSSAGNSLSVTDPDAGVARRFYRVEISR